MDDGNHEALIDSILQRVSMNAFESTNDELSVSPEDVRLFLANISKRNVDFTADALNLLQKYFVASRVERPGMLKNCFNKRPRGFLFCFLYFFL